MSKAAVKGSGAGKAKGGKVKGGKAAKAAPAPRGRWFAGVQVAAVGAAAGAAAGAVAAVAASQGRFNRMTAVLRGTGHSPPVGGTAGRDSPPQKTGASGVAAGGDGFAAGGAALRFEGLRFDVACLKPGATRDFLRARYPGQKPQFAIAAETGIPADTVRKAMAWQGASELSGPHLMRMVSVFGPPFLAAVLDPVPRWVSEWMEGRDG